MVIKKEILELTYFFKNKGSFFVLVELKRGGLCNGKAISIDEFWNILIEESFLLTKDGSLVKNTPRILIKGNSIKRIRFF